MGRRGRVSNVVKLELVEVGENFRFENDTILEAAKGEEFTTLASIGGYADGSTYIAGTANAGETLVLMERAKRKIVFGEE